MPIDNSPSGGYVALPEHTGCRSNQQAYRHADRADNNANQSVNLPMNAVGCNNKQQNKQQTEQATRGRKQSQWPNSWKPHKDLSIFLMSAIPTPSIHQQQHSTPIHANANYHHSHSACSSSYTSTPTTPLLLTITCRSTFYHPILARSIVRQRVVGGRVVRRLRQLS
jgi:hypothetical protein